MASKILLYPNVDVQVEWDFPPPPDHWETIDEPLGTEPDVGYVFASKDNLPGDEDRWGFETIWNVLYVVQADYELFGAIWKGVAGYNFPGIDLYLGGWLGLALLDTWDNLGWKWHSEVYAGIQKSQTDLDGMLGAAIVPAFDERGDQIRIQAVHVYVYIIWQECGRKINRRINGRINDGLN
jgi:hypothetical protein